jgi:hypothetical protein
MPAENANDRRRQIALEQGRTIPVSINPDRLGFVAWKVNANRFFAECTMGVHWRYETPVKIADATSRGETPN